MRSSFLKPYRPLSFNFLDGNGPVTAHRHINPDGNLGGWVAESAFVARTVHAGKDARIYGRATVYGEATLFGKCRVHGNAEVFGHAWILGNAEICDDAKVYDNGWVFGNVKVSRDTHIFDNPFNDTAKNLYPARLSLASSSSSGNSGVQDMVSRAR